MTLLTIGVAYLNSGEVSLPGTRGKVLQATLQSERSPRGGQFQHGHLRGALQVACKIQRAYLHEHECRHLQLFAVADMLAGPRAAGVSFLHEDLEYQKALLNDKGTIVTSAL